MESTKLESMSSEELQEYILNNQESDTEEETPDESVNADIPEETQDPIEEDTADSIEYEEETPKEVVEEPVEESIEPNTYTIKADGKEYNFTLDELKIAASKGINYTQKTTALKPYRNMIKAMQDNGVNENDINMLIDIKKGNKEALSKLVKDTNVDPYDLPEDVSNYQPNEYRQSEQSLEIAETIDALRAEPEFSRTSQVIANLDNQSKEFLSSRPNMIAELHTSIKNGEFDLVAPEAEKLSLLDGHSKPFLQYYFEAGQKLIQAGKLTIANQTIAQQEPKAQPKQAVNPQVAKAKKAASLPSSRADKKTVIDYLDADGNIDMDSEEFNKAYAAFNAKLQRKY